MAEPITLAEAKAHLRLDADLTEDDGLIVTLITSAREQAEHQLGFALATLWPDVTQVPASIRQWMLLAVGTLYANREAVIVGATVNRLPHGFCDGLLDPWRTFP